jgi:hypothetical protein
VIEDHRSNSAAIQSSLDNFRIARHPDTIPLLLIAVLLDPIFKRRGLKWVAIPLPRATKCYFFQQVSIQAGQK